jgi:LPPG:FO 2-phospho-L-lactate transferase
MTSPWRNVVLLSGGVGGARFVDGVAAALEPGTLTVVVNTGDDFEHWGLHIAPDLDTVMYTLSGLAHVERGWGLYDETFHALQMVGRYGGADWFQLGDRDLGTHLMRTEMLRRGELLTAATAQLCTGLDITSVAILPMCDGRRSTMIDCADGRTLSFQDWLVRERAAAEVAAVRFEGVTTPSPAVLAAIDAAELVLVAPSNPYVSIEPITTLDGVAEALAGKTVVGVSPIIGGEAVKGPLAAMIPALDGVAPSAAAVARRYAPWLDGFAVSPGDEDGLDGVRVLSTDVLMRDVADRRRLAEEVLAFAREAL